MTTTAQQQQQVSQSQSGVYRLPERLRTSGALLLTSDGLAAIIALAVCVTISGSGAGAFASLAATLLVGAMIGRYRKSFCIHIYEEWYATVAAALLGALIGVAFSLLMQFDWFSAIGASDRLDAVCRHRSRVSA